MKFLHCFCVVDSSLRILWVGGDWDDFALRNGGSAALANDVLSKPLTSFITDAETAGSVAQMVKVVIDIKGLLRMDYRCDGPEELRRFRLTIKPMKDARAIMVHELRDAVRLNPPMDTWAFDPGAAAQKCSVCGFVHLPDQAWKDPAQPGERHPPLVRYTVCPSCTAKIEMALSDIVEGAGEGEVGELSLKSGMNNS